MPSQSVQKGDPGWTPAYNDPHRGMTPGEASDDYNGIKITSKQLDMETVSEGGAAYTLANQATFKTEGFTRTTEGKYASASMRGSTVDATGNVKLSTRTKRS